MEISDVVDSKLRGPGHMTACLHPGKLLLHPDKHMPSQATWPHREDGEENLRQTVGKRYVGNEAIEEKGLQSRTRRKALDMDISATTKKFAPS